MKLTSQRIAVLLMMIAFVTSLFPQIATGEVFKWVDEKGTVHFTEDPSTIPEKYRQQSERKFLPKDSTSDEPLYYEWKLSRDKRTGQLFFNGYLKNNTKRGFWYTYIDVNCYDENGNRIDSFRVETRNLEPGEKYKFEKQIFDKRTKDVRIVETYPDKSSMILHEMPQKRN